MLASVAMRRWMAPLMAVPLIGLSAVSHEADAQSRYPDQPVRLIIPYATGGNTDLVGRVLALGLTRQLGQNVFVDNRGGGGGRIGQLAAAQAKPDGYTLLMSNRSAHIFQRAIPPELNYNPEAMITIGVFAKVPAMLGVPSSLGVGDMRAAVELFRASPGKYAYGSAGVGTLTHIGPDIFAKMAGLDMIHVPYKGTGPVLLDMAAGRIAFGMLSPSSTAPYFKKGELRALAVLEAKRLAEFPDVPTIAEAGYPDMLKYGWSVWNAIIVPAGTPAAIVEQLNGAMARAVQDPEIVKRFRDLGNDPEHMSVRDANQFMQQQFALWVPIIKALGLQQ